MKFKVGQKWLSRNKKEEYKIVSIDYYLTYPIEAIRDSDGVSILFQKDGKWSSDISEESEYDLITLLNDKPKKYKIKNLTFKNSHLVAEYIIYRCGGNVAEALADEILAQLKFNDISYLNEMEVKNGRED